MKSRGVYETPGGTILHAAHRGIESLTLDRGAAHLKDELMPRYAELIYNGFWFAPEREMLQALIDKSQENVTGTVRLKLYKGHARVVGRKSPNSLYDLRMVTFEADQGAYNQRDAEGFIKLNALRLRLGVARPQEVRRTVSRGMPVTSASRDAFICPRGGADSRASASASCATCRRRFSSMPMTATMSSTSMSSSDARRRCSRTSTKKRSQT
jgi:hypothetical protein